MAQETSMSLGPFFVFLIILHWICHLHLQFLSCPRHCPHHVLPLFLLCHVVVHPCPHPCHHPVVVVPVIVLWLPLLSCGGCPPHHWSSSPGPHCCCCLSVLSCPVVFVVMATLLFVVVCSMPVARFHPMSSCLQQWGAGGCCHHPSSTPQAGACSSGIICGCAVLVLSHGK
jgi:hypothetical protein